MNYQYSHLPLLSGTARTCAPGLTWERGKAFRGEWRPSCSLSVCSWIARWPKEGQFSCPLHLWLPLPSVEPVRLYQLWHFRRKGSSQTECIYISLGKPFFLVISVYLKYFSIIIIKGASGHRATDRARDVSPQSTRDRLKKFFYNFENISLLFPLVSPKHTVFITYPKYLIIVNICGMHSMCQALWSTSPALSYLISIERSKSNTGKKIHLQGQP